MRKPFTYSYSGPAVGVGDRGMAARQHCGDLKDEGVFHRARKLRGWEIRMSWGEETEIRGKFMCLTRCRERGLYLVYGGENTHGC